MSTSKISSDAIFNAPMKEMPLSDQSSSSLPVVNMGEATVVTDEVFGAVAAFDGKAGTQLLLPKADSAGLNLKEHSFTVCAWVKINKEAVFTGWRYASILGMDEITQPNQCLHLTLQEVGSGLFRPYFGFFSNDLGGSAIIQRDRWYHVAFSYEHSSKMRSIYVDGVLNIQNTTTANFIGEAEVYIGKSLGGFYFNGQMFNVRIYDRELSQGEVQQDRNEAFLPYLLTSYLPESLTHLDNFDNNQIQADKDFGKALVISDSDDGLMVKQSAYNLGAQEGVVDSFSLELWLRPDMFSSSGQWSNVVSCSNPNGAFWAVSVGALTGIYWSASSDDSNKTLFADATQIPAINSGKDVIFLKIDYFENELRLFVDGQLAASQSGLSGGFPWPGTALKIADDSALADFLPLLTLNSPTNPGLLASVFSQDGSKLFGGNLSGKICVFDANTGLLLNEITAGPAIGNDVNDVALALSPNGKYLFSSLSKKTIDVWDAVTFENIGNLAEHTANITDIAASPDGKTIASVSWDRTVRVWDTDNFNQIAVLTGHEDAIYSVAFHPSENKLVTASEDGTFRIWNVETVTEIKSIHVPMPPNRAHQAVFNHDGSKILVSAYNLFIYDILSDSIVKTINPEVNVMMLRGNYSPDGSRILVWTLDDTQQITTISVLNTTTYEEISSPFDPGFRASHLTISADGAKVACASASGSQIQLLQTSHLFSQSGTLSFNGRVYRLSVNKADANSSATQVRERLITDLVDTEGVTVFPHDVDSQQLIAQLVDLPLDRVTPNATVINQAPFQTSGRLIGTAVTLTDDVFGRAMDFSSADDRIRIQPLSIKNVGADASLTLEFWVHPATTLSNNSTVIFAGAGSGPYWLVRVGTASSVEWSNTEGGDVNSLFSQVPVISDSWSHITLVYTDHPDTTGKQLSFFINGKLSNQTELTEFPWTLDDISLGNCDPAINRRTNSPFLGRLANVRINTDQAKLNSQAIRDRMEKDLLRTAIGTLFPLEFNLLNEQDQTVLYLGDRPKTLRLQIKNTGTKNIRLGDTSFTDNHLSLYFRPGTLQLPEKITTHHQAWSCVYQQNLDGTDVFKFRFLAEAGSAQNPSQTLTPGETLTIGLSNILLESTSGSRATHVQMRYQLQYDDSSPLEGSRLHYLSILQMSESELHQRLETISETQLPELHNNLTQVQNDLTGVDSQVGGVKNQLDQAKNNITAIQTDLEDKVDKTSHTALSERVNNLQVDEAKLTALINQLNAIDTTEANLIQQINVDVQTVASDVGKVGDDVSDIIDNLNALSDRVESPLFIGIEGAGVILNDGQSTNAITISISNESDEDIALSNDTKVFIKVYGGIKSGPISAPKWSITDDLASIIQSDLSHDWQVDNRDINPSGYIKFVLTPVAGSAHKLIKGQPLTLTLSGFSCSLPTGRSLIEIFVENISKPGETKTTVFANHLLTIERGPIAACPDAVISGATELVLNPTLNFRKGRFIAGNSNPCTASLFLDGEALCISGKNGVKFGSEKTEVPNLHLSGTVKGGSHDIKGLNHVEADTIAATNGITYSLKPGNLVPKGAIIMWSGSSDKLPDGWVLCNGQSLSIPINGSNRAPDLRDKFIVGAGDIHKKVNETGGQESFTITSGNLPKHSHAVVDPGHSHSFNRNFLVRDASTDSDDDSLPMYASNSASSLATNASSTNISINSGGGVSDPVAISTIPPFYALCFIMKT